MRPLPTSVDSEPLPSSRSACRNSSTKFVGRSRSPGGRQQLPATLIARVGRQELDVRRAIRIHCRGARRYAAGGHRASRQIGLYDYDAKYPASSCRRPKTQRDEGPRGATHCASLGCARRAGFRQETNASRALRSRSTPARHDAAQLRRGQAPSDHAELLSSKTSDQRGAPPRPARRARQSRLNAARSEKVIDCACACARSPRSARIHRSDREDYEEPREGRGHRRRPYRPPQVSPRRATADGGGRSGRCAR